MRVERSNGIEYFLGGTTTGTWTTETLGVNVIIKCNNITYIFPAAARRFAGLKVVSP